MELDAEEVKKLCKFQKPLSGIITCEMGNIQDFEAALQTFAENQIKPIERNGMKCVEIDRKVAFAYDSEKLFVFKDVVHNTINNLYFFNE